MTTASASIAIVTRLPTYSVESRAASASFQPTVLPDSHASLIVRYGTQAAIVAAHTASLSRPGASGAAGRPCG